MANILFLQSMDFASVTADSEVAGYEAVKAGNDYMEEEWRPNGTSGYLLIDLGAEVAFDTVAAINVRSTGSFTMRVRSDDDSDPTAGADWDTGVDTYGSSRLDDAPVSHAIAVRSSPVTSRYVRIDLADADNVGGFGVNRILIGNRFEPKCNYDYGMQHVTSPAIAPGRNILNSPDIAPTAIRDDVTISLPYLNPDEALGDMAVLQRGAALGKPMLLHLNIDDTAHYDQKLFYGLARAGIRRRHQSHQSYAISIELIGLI